jgi:chromate reductase, NAD(P)H dehydrogenase (quinone)
MDSVRVLTISGSLRRDSLNTRLLRQAEAIAPPGVQFDHFDRLGEIPLFNEDEEHPAPAAVADLRARVGSADAVLIATPEYNSSIPGGLKNAIDWLSRPDGATPCLIGKPVAIAGASTGPFGTVRAQLALRQVLHKVNATVLGQPEMLLFHAHQQFDENGALPPGSPASKLLTQILDGLIDLVARQRQPVTSTLPDPEKVAL